MSLLFTGLSVHGLTRIRGMSESSPLGPSDGVARHDFEHRHLISVSEAVALFLHTPNLARMRLPGNEHMATSVTVTVRADSEIVRSHKYLTDVRLMDNPNTRSFRYVAEMLFGGTN